MHRIVPAIAAALAFVVAITPLLGSLHGAAVRHVACPEDGELIDALPQAPHAHRRVSGSSHELFSERDPGSPNGDEQDHDHCAVAQQAQLRASDGARPAMPAAPPDGSAAVQRAFEGLELSGFVLYRLAPKASPPA